MNSHNCKFEDLEVVMELSDVFNHSIRSMDAISPRFPLLRFAALLHDIGKADTRTLNSETQDFNFFFHEVVSEKQARNICKRLKFSNEETEYITTIIRNHMYFVTGETKPNTIRRWLRNNPFYRDNLRLRIADRRGNLVKVGRASIPFRLKDLIRKIKKIENEKPALQVTDLVINGHDLIALGLKPGPIFGKILNELLEQVLDNPEKNNREYLLEEIEQYIEENKNG